MNKEYHSELKFSNIDKKYDKQVVFDNFNVTIPLTECTVLLGASGSGKTTLFNLISGIIKPDKGDIDLDGDIISSMNEDQLAEYRYQNIGYVFQNYNLIEYLSVYDNITFFNDDADMFASICSRLGIEKLVDKYPSELSGGEQQRVAIARVFMQRPKLILADEPSGALDNESTQKLMNLFKQLCEEFNMKMLLVTHDESLIKYAQCVCKIVNGEIIFL